MGRLLANWNGQLLDQAELFDLDADSSERINLAAKHPAKVAELTKLTTAGSIRWPNRSAAGETLGSAEHIAAADREKQQLRRRIEQKKRRDAEKKA